MSIEQPIFSFILVPSLRGGTQLRRSASHAERVNFPQPQSNCGRIYFIDNVKFHVDEVKGLGNFVEVEAIDEDGIIIKSVLREQCGHYVNLFDIAKEDLVAESYSDLL